MVSVGPELLALTFGEAPESLAWILPTVLKKEISDNNSMELLILPVIVLNLLLASMFLEQSDVFAAVAL